MPAAVAETRGKGRNEEAAGVAAARRATIAALVVWFAAAVAAGALGRVNEPGRPPLVLASFVLVPILGFLAAYAASRPFRAYTETVAMPLLVGSHLWRLVGIGFVVGASTGALAAGFGIPAGVGDIIAALWAVLLLPSLRRESTLRGSLLAWNVFGLFDLLLAITLGVLYSESAAGVLHTTRSNTRLLTAFPFSLIPTFFVPLFILVHLLVFRRLARRVGGNHAVSR